MSLDRLFKAHDIVSHKSPLVHMFGNVENSMESVPSRKSNRTRSKSLKSNELEIP